MSETIYAAACARASEGMEVAAIAARDPGRLAIESELGSLTYAELNAQANRIANRLREAGIQAGDAVALLCSNRPGFVAVRFACHRLGIRLTPVNWHLSADEVTYIVSNCDARALFADIRVADTAKSALAASDKISVAVAIGGSIDGFEDWSELDRYSVENIDNPSRGTEMMYTSGTTGRPKGVLRSQPDPQKAADIQNLITSVFQFDTESGTDKALCGGPLYHTGPFNLCMTTPLTAGIGTVLMDKWDAEKTLQIIDEKKVTHSFMVPTMFVRLLQLDETVRQRYELSSLKFILHGAAPCSVDTKQAMLAWFGPVIWEMFAATEGPGTFVSPHEWLAKPGTVGKPAPGQFRILDEDGRELPNGESGLIYIINPVESSFTYFKDPDKTDSSTRDGYFTCGDIGCLDEDGYLFITGRSAETIISGGVNLYPQEIDDVLAKHPLVVDVACVGVPNIEWGEEIKAVVELRSGAIASAELAAEMIDFIKPHLARQKWPRSVDFVDELPRSHAGKVLRRALRDQYWQHQDKSI